MKAIICIQTNSVEIYTFGTAWTSCPCGNVKAKWLDPMAGTVAVAARNRDNVRLLGMNNNYLIPAIRQESVHRGVSGLTWEEYRDLHEIAVNAPNFLFDKERICCWAAVVKIGRSNDVRWATDDEFIEAFPK